VLPPDIIEPFSVEAPMLRSFRRDPSISSILTFRSIPVMAALAALGGGLALGGCQTPPDQEETVDLFQEQDPGYEEQLVKGCASTQKTCGFDATINARVCCHPAQTCAWDESGPYCEGDIPPLRSGTMTPQYTVLSMIYAPPGRDSEVSYETGSTAAVRQETKKSWTLGAKVQVEADLGVAQGSFGVATGAGQIGGTAVESRKEVGSAIGAGVPSTRIGDDPQCSEDLYYLWIGPALDVVETQYNQWKVKVPQVDASKIHFVSVGELQDPSKVTGSRAQALAPVLLSAKARSELLKLNPCTTGAALDPLRYLFIKQVRMESPAAGGAIPFVTYTLKNEGAASDITGTNVEVEVEALFGGGVGVVDILAGGYFRWSYERIKETSIGAYEEAEVRFQTDTPNYDQLWDIYYDKNFKTFNFRKAQVPAGAQAVSGTLIDESGNPVANETLRILLPDGVIRETVTRADGSYGTGPMPAGKAQITARGRTQEVEVGSRPVTDLVMEVTSTAGL
jgi:hypothetical protein